MDPKLVSLLCTWIFKLSFDESKSKKSGKVM